MLRLKSRCSFLHGVVMFKEIAPEGYFDIIKQNYHAYLRANMVTHLGSYRARALIINKGISDLNR